MVCVKCFNYIKRGHSDKYLVIKVTSKILVNPKGYVYYYSFFSNIICFYHNVLFHIPVYKLAATLHASLLLKITTQSTSANIELLFIQTKASNNETVVISDTFWNFYFTSNPFQKAVL